MNRDTALLLAVDLSQVEGRIGYVLTGDPELIKLAQSRPEDSDMHVENAARIFRVPPSQVTKRQRYLGKITTHGVLRGMTGKRLHEVLLKDGMFLPVAECQDLIDAYLRQVPAVPEWMERVRREVAKTGRLRTCAPWRRELSFRHDRAEPETYRKAYSFLMQAIAADHMNDNGLVPVYEACHVPGGSLYRKATLLLQNHDELLLEVQLGDLHEVMTFIALTLSTPIVIEPTGLQCDPVHLVVPVTFKIGKTWAGGVELHRVPATPEELFHVVLSKS